jgi:magnesium transporter
MSENVMQVVATGINVIQAEVSNKLATLIVWLTVAGTAVLVPNTLATVFSIFPSSDDNFYWMLPALAVSTVISAFVTYRYTKRWKVKSFGMRKLRSIKKKLRYN